MALGPCAFSFAEGSPDKNEKPLGSHEREGEDQALIARLGVPAVNLRLHARSEEVFSEDRKLSNAYKARQDLLRHLQDFYRLRLDYADDAARAIAVRHVTFDWAPRFLP